MTRRPSRLVVAAVAAVLLGAVPLAGVGGAEDGPRVSVDRIDVNVGEPLIATLSGFTSQQVTVAVCGNLAKRGSADCNMPQAQSERIREDRNVTTTQLFAQAPPVPCPCLVLAYSPTTEEFAVTSINLVGHPTAPVVDSEAGPLVEVAVEARRVGGGLIGWARSSLGGPTSFEVTVSVRNVSTAPLSDVVLRGSAEHRFDDDAAILEFDRPPTIEPGQTWEQTVEAEIHPPVAGRFTWRVVASGAGETISASTPTAAVPVLLYLVAVVLVVDIAAIVWRFRRRTRRERDEPEAPESWEEIQARWEVEGAGRHPEPSPGPLRG